MHEAPSTQGGFKKAERRFATGFGATIRLSHPQADWKSALRPVCPGDGFFLESVLRDGAVAKRKLAEINSLRQIDRTKPNEDPMLNR